MLLLPVEHRSCNIGWKRAQVPPPPDQIWKFFVKHLFCSQRFGNKSGDRFGNIFGNRLEGAKSAASFFNLFGL